jgi:hypothetical protein
MRKGCRICQSVIHSAGEQNREWAPDPHISINVIIHVYSFAKLVLFFTVNIKNYTTPAA